MSAELEKEFLLVLGISKEQKTKEHWSCLCDIVFAINEAIIHESSTAMLDKLPTRAPAFVDINSLPVEVRGKIRYCGGWALAKTRETLRKYIKANLVSSKEKIQGSVNEAYIKKKAIDSLTFPSTSIHSSSSIPETLSVTDRRQYSRGGLTHIRDITNTFFLELEEKRVQLMNSDRLRIWKCDLISSAIDSTKADTRLLGTWNKA